MNSEYLKEHCTSRLSDFSHIFVRILQGELSCYCSYVTIITVTIIIPLPLYVTIITKL